MATLTIRGLDPEVKERLRMRAAGSGRSMEAEAREILQDAVASEAATGLGTWISRRFAVLDGAEFDIPPRADAPRAADLA